MESVLSSPLSGFIQYFGLVKNFHLISVKKEKRKRMEISVGSYTREFRGWFLSSGWLGNGSRPRAQPSLLCPHS